MPGQQLSGHVLVCYFANVSWTGLLPCLDKKVHAATPRHFFEILFSLSASGATATAHAAASAPAASAEATTASSSAAETAAAAPAASAARAAKADSSPSATTAAHATSAAPAAKTTAALLHAPAQAAKAAAGLDDGMAYRFRERASYRRLDRVARLAAKHAKGAWVQYAGAKDPWRPENTRLSERPTWAKYSGEDERNKHDYTKDKPDHTGHQGPYDGKRGP
jgi:hypothetical protein